MSDRIDSQDYEMPALDTAYFKDIRIFVSTIGFHRSGSSLVGYLLTAHRNIIIAHEPRIKNTDLYELTAKELFNWIIAKDKNRFRAAKEFIENSQKSSSLRL